MARKEYLSKTFLFDGRRYYVCGKDEDDLILKKVQKLKELEEGQIKTSSTVRQWAAVWMDTYVRPRGIEPASLRMYEDALKNVILPRIGAVQLRRVTATQLQQLMNTRSGMSQSHASKLRIVIRSMFRQAFLNRIIPFDPSADLKLPKTTKGTHRSLTEPEREALLAFAKLPKLDGKPNLSAPWVLSMLYCGLRPGETAALQWRDVDLSAAMIHVAAAKEAASNRFKAPKTDSGYRDIPIPAVYLPCLQAIAKPSGYVFTQSDGKTPLTDSSMKRRWETVKKYMDIYLGATVEKVKPSGKRKHITVITQHALSPDLDLYDLRHTYCTDLQKKGVPINIAKVLMGHSDISVTANIYTHSDMETTELARRFIDGQ